MTPTWIAITSLIVSAVSLALALRTYNVNRRTMVFQKITEVRAKSFRLRWQIDANLNELRSYIDQSSHHDARFGEGWETTIAELQQMHTDNDALDLEISELFDNLSAVPLIVPPPHMLEIANQIIERHTARADHYKSHVVPKLKSILTELKAIKDEPPNKPSESIDA